VQALCKEAALACGQRDESALALLLLLASEAGRGAGLRLQASSRNRDAASQALTEGPVFQSFEGSVDCRHFSGISSSQHRTPLAQDGDPAVNFIR